MAVAEQQSVTLRALVRQITNSLAVDHLPVTDMSLATSLELDPTITLGTQDGHPAASEIRRIEGDIRAQPVPRHRDTAPVRYFLDGSQKTVPVWRVGSMPVVVTATAVGILHRTTPDQVELLPGSLHASLHWIIPCHTGDPTLERICELLHEMGQHITDPIDDTHRDSADDYDQAVQRYAHVMEQAYSTASNVRSRAEAMVLEQWAQSRPADDASWIVVDGRLGSPVPRAIGLIKRAQAQHLDGAEAIALYDLPVGQRTSAYVYVESENRERPERTMWYLRMQNASRQDARHGLVRLEVPSSTIDPGQIDLISSWILAERAPRASSDSRWPTLVYPIHLLERMLKRRIRTLTAGWPA